MPPTLVRVQLDTTSYLLRIPQMDTAATRRREMVAPQENLTEVDDFASISESLRNFLINNQHLLNRRHRRRPNQEDLSSHIITEDDVNNETECNVCLESFVIDESVKMLACKHKYHEKCIGPWLRTNTTCPTCRRDVCN